MPPSPVASTKIQQWLMQLRTYDRLTLAYLSLVLCFLAISPARPLTASRIAIVHVAAILIILVLPQLAARWRAARILHDFYPAALFMVLFSELNDLSTVLFPYWMEPILIRFDAWAFEGSAHQWAATTLSAGAAEFFAFAYWSYYLIIPATLFIAARKNYPVELVNATTRMCATMYACYVMFMLVPARGPQDALPNDGVLMTRNGLFTNMVRTIQSHGSVHGAAFPSSHVAVAWIMFFTTARIYPRVAPLAVLLPAALTLSTITMGYHFSLDAVAGAALAIGINSAWRQKEDREQLVTQMNR